MAEKNPLQWVEDQLNAEVRKRAAEKGVPLNVAAQEFIAELGPGFDLEVTRKANARLIAAAPALFTRCDADESGSCGDCDMCRAVATIEQAVRRG